MLLVEALRLVVLVSSVLFGLNESLLCVQHCWEFLLVASGFWIGYCSGEVSSSVGEFARILELLELFRLSFGFSPACGHFVTETCVSSSSSVRGEFSICSQMFVCLCRSFFLHRN